MPIYEYECSKCGHCVEVIQRFSDDPLTECPECHGTMKKLMSMNSFHLKGSGWYVTDYASKRSTCSASPTASEGSGEAKKPSGSSKSEPSSKTGGADSTSKE